MRPCGRLDEGDDGPDIRGNVGRGDDDEREPADLEPYLLEASYPVRKSDLVEGARRGGAPKHVQEILDRLPDREFQDLYDVSRAVGEAS